MTTTQVSWRADADLIVRVKRAAADSGRSLNEYISVVLDAVTDPAHEADEAVRIRERLARAGLLVAPQHAGRRPSRAALARAAERAAQGTPAARLVHDAR